MVEALEKMRYPSDVVFDRYELEIGEAFEHAGENNFGERSLDRMMQRGVAFHHALKIAAAATLSQDMQAERSAEIVRHRPEWIVRRVAVRTLGRRRAPDHRAAQAFFRGPTELLDSFERIVERNHRDSRQAPRAVRAVIGQPIVVRPKARRAQFAVLHLKQPHPKARIEHLARDAVALLVFDS